MRLKTWLVAALGLGSLVVADCGVDAGVVAQGAGHLRAARSARTRTIAASRPSSGGCAPTSTCRAFSSATTCSTSSASGHPSTASSSPSSARPTWRRWPSFDTLVRHDERITSLQTKLDDYWETFDPLFDWTPAEKILRSAAFLRREVVPRREAALTIAQEIEELNNANLAGQRAEVAQAARRVPRTICTGCSGRRSCWASSSRWSSSFGCACSSGARRKPSGRCASCRSSWSTRRRRSGRTCLASCTITWRRC